MFSVARGHLGRSGFDEKKSAGNFPTAYQIVAAAAWNAARRYTHTEWEMEKLRPLSVKSAFTD